MTRVSKRRKLRVVSFGMTVWLTLVWMAAFASIRPITILSGILVALLVQAVLPMPLHKDVWHLRFGYLFVLVIRFAWDLVSAGTQVASLVLSGKHHKDGIVECQLKSKNPVYATIVAAMSSMVPGTVVLEVKPKQKVMYLHCLDLPKQGGAAGVRATVAEQEKRILLAFATDKAVIKAGYGNYLPISSRRHAKKSDRAQDRGQLEGRP